MTARTLLVALVFCATRTASAQFPAVLQQGAQTARTPAEAVAVLKAHYFAADFAGGDLAGTELTKRFPQSDEVRAWHVVNMARLDARDDDALAITDSAAIWKERSQLWRNFARSFALCYQDGRQAEAVDVARLARARAPWTTDAVWLHGYVLHRAEKYSDVVALVDSALTRGRPSSEVLIVKANALVSLSHGPPRDTALRRRAAEAFAEARRVDPSNVTAMYLPAANLSGGPTDTVAFGLLERAKDLTPSVSVHQAYWRAIRARRDLDSLQKQGLIRSDVAALLAARPTLPAVVWAAYQAYAEMKDTVAQQPLAARLTTEFDNTVEAEWYWHQRVSALSSAIYRMEVDTATAIPELRGMIAAFAARPRIRYAPLLGDMLLTDYGYVKADSTISTDSLLAFSKALVEYNRINPHITHVDVPMLLAERKSDFRYAERLVAEGDSIRRKRLEERKDFYVTQRGVGEYADMLDNLAATMHNARGWIYLHEGRLDDAERELEEAIELTRQHPHIHYSFGKLAEARGDLGGAQAHYARGFPLEQTFTGFRNRDALKRIYASNTGSLDGFDAYVEELKTADRERRKAKIAGERLAEGPVMPAFNLERYGSAERVKLNSAQLAGKVVVVNFWGVWCGPCIKEIPDIQKFHEAVKDDTSVVFLTVDYRDTPEELHDFMTKRKLAFPVILDAENWVSHVAQVSSFPTTWFVDRDGRIAFKHIGASDVVLEEFLWRVEMLKAAEATRPD